MKYNYIETELERIKRNRPVAPKQREPLWVYVLFGLIGLTMGLLLTGIIALTIGFFKDAKELPTAHRITDTIIGPSLLVDSAAPLREIKGHQHKQW